MSRWTGRSRWSRWRHRRSELGYAAVLVAILCPVVFIGCAALSVDTARWYVEAERVQAAADAAALAGVVWMPNDLSTARTTALAEAKKNGYDSAASNVSVTVEQGNKPSRLKVTVSSTISNSFGTAIGTPTTTVTRRAVADYAGALSMGSPCNEFASDPDSTSSVTSGNCSGVGDFWANVGSLQSDKSKGDAFQNNVCAAGVDGCTTSAGPNADYDADGYIYTVTASRNMSNLQLQAFDPALISVGDHCASNLAGAASIPPSHTVVSNPATRYASGDGAYCTGDNDFDTTAVSTGFADQVATNFTVRQEGANDDASRPATWPALSSGQCPGAKTYPGYDGNLSTALDTTNAGYVASVAATFRQWVTLCSLSNVSAGTTFAIQVKTNGIGSDTANGHNRFSLRGYASSPSAKDYISISAFDKMAVYANVQGGASASRFFLTRVPSSTAGETLTVSLFDIGDITGTGTIKFVAPSESGVTFSNCRGVGPVPGPVPGPVSNCQFTASSAFNGKWERVYIPIPSTYTCNDTSPTGCWVRLYYDLSGAASAQDTTSWRSTIDGQPVRLVQ